MRILIHAGIMLSVFAVLSEVRGDDVGLRIAVFEADITPPIGAPLCDALVPPAKEIVDKLSARGVVLVSADKPIVLCPRLGGNRQQRV